MVILNDIEEEIIPDDEVLSVRTRDGRAAARSAWMWDGTPTVLTLSWNPDGTAHDSGAKYLLKKHCMCCGDSGFTRHCRKCRKNACGTCNSSRDKSKIIPCFYINKDSVPFQSKFYGDINCFLETCARRSSQGFQSEEDMHMHAMSRHTKQFEAHQAVKRSTQASEIDSLKEQVNLLLAASILPGAKTVIAGIEELTAGDLGEAPLYVSDKPTKSKKTRRKRQI